MAFGFSTIGDTGAVQIDDESTNWFVTGSGTATSVTYAGSYSAAGAISLLYITLPAPATIIFSTTIPIAKKAGVYGDYSIVSGQYQYIFTVFAAVGTSVPYLIVDFAPGSLGDAGLAIWNAAGTLVYSTDGDPARVAAQWDDFNPDPTNWSPLNSWTLTLPAGRTYAVLYNQPLSYIHFYQTGGGGTRYASIVEGFASISSNVVTMQERPVVIAGPRSGLSATHHGSIRFNLLILDITGY